MILKVQPARSLVGTVRLPASKSYSIRAFLIAACGGHSRIIEPSDCDDAVVAVSVSRQLGAKIKISKNIFIVQAGKLTVPRQKINVKESGTVLRLLLPLLSLTGEKAQVIGEGTLRGRPNRHLLNALREQGVAISATGPQESIPIRINGGKLKGGRISIDGSVSSQFVSALLIACPQLKNSSSVHLRGKKLVSTDYIEMTTAVLQKAGIVVKKVNSRRFDIPGGQTFKGLKDFHVPSDYGLAAFLMAAAAILPSEVTFEGHFDDHFVQADGKVLEFLAKMGVKWTRAGNIIRMRGPFHLKAGAFSLKDCPDLVPIMAVLGLFASGVTKLTDIGHARVKESDRISDLRMELLKLGARVEEGPNSLTVYPLASFPRNIVLDPHHDHRLAMAFTVLGLKTGLNVKDIECVSKSYPHFVRDLRGLRALVQIS